MTSFTHPATIQLLKGMEFNRILENWVIMVEKGKWKIDENGVAEGVDKFKEADTEQHCDDYIISESW